MLTSCHKEDIGDVSIRSSSKVTFEGAFTAKIYVDAYAFTNDEVEFEWAVMYSTDPDPKKYGQSAYFGYGSSCKDTIKFSGLDPLTTYYVQPYAIGGGKSYFSDEIISFQTDTGKYVGDIGPAGGIIYYVSDDGWGVEMSTTEFDYNNWGCEDVVQGTSKQIGDGGANTSIILQACPSETSAPAICANYEQNGYTDWHLPTYYDLVEINNVLVVPGIWTPINNWYLSSSDGSHQDGSGWFSSYYSYNYLYGQVYNSQKGMTHKFFPVRRFEL